jgi:hypothetical protein
MVVERWSGHSGQVGVFIYGIVNAWWCLVVFCGDIVTVSWFREVPVGAEGRLS